MLNEKEMDELIQPIIDIYNQLELELFKEIGMRLSTYNGVSGSLEWYLDKVKEMGILNENAVKIIAKYSKLSEKRIKEILEKAQYSVVDVSTLEKAFEKGVIKIKPQDLLNDEIFKRTLIDSFKDTQDTFKLIQTKALESVQSRYMDVLNKAYIETASGIYSYNYSIRHAMKEMAQKGITGATYKRNNGTIVNYSIESAVRRDILTAVEKTITESAMREVKELGAEYVEVTSHIGARTHDTNPIADHAGWQGKIYKLDGKDEKYDNFYEKTGYGELLGLGGVNCRHHFFAFFPGISIPTAQQIDLEENERVYKLTQKQRKMEREIRKLKKEKICYEQIQDEEAIKDVNKRIRMKSRQLNEFCNANDLRRDRSREVIANE